MAQAQEGSGKSQDAGGRVVLVLPFDNRSGNPNLNWVGDSFPDTLNQRLSSAGFLTISRDDRLFALDHLGLPANFRPSRATTIRIAEQLDAEYVIVGSFNISGPRIQVQAQILNVPRLRLSPPLQDSAELARLFDVENAIAWNLARQLDPHFAVAEQTFLSASAGVRLSSFESYIRGTSAQTGPERVHRLELAVQESPNYSAAVLALGKQQYLDRNYDQAAATLARIPADDRMALEAGFYRGLANFNNTRYAEAEQAFTFVASRLPLPEVVNDQGVALSRQNRDGSAYFTRAVAADPNDPDYQFNLAVASYRRGDFAAATSSIAAALKLRPNDQEARDLQTLISAGRTPVPALAGFTPVTRLRRTWSEASFRQAAFQLDQMRSLRMATLPPAQRAAEYTQSGREYLTQGLLPEAEIQFSEAITADPNVAAPHLGLAEIRLRSNNLPAARTEVQSSLRLQPTASAWVLMGRLDLQANNLPAAAGDVGNALRLEPGNAAAQQLRLALQQHGQAVP